MQTHARMPFARSTERQLHASPCFTDPVSHFDNGKVDLPLHEAFPIYSIDQESQQFYAFPPSQYHAGGVSTEETLENTISSNVCDYGYWTEEFQPIFSPFDLCDRQDTPWSASDVSIRTPPPFVCSTVYNTPEELHADVQSDARTISMPDVQMCADPVPDFNLDINARHFHSGFTSCSLQPLDLEFVTLHTTCTAQPSSTPMASQTTRLPNVEPPLLRSRGNASRGTSTTRQSRKKGVYKRSTTPRSIASTSSNSSNSSSSGSKVDVSRSRTTDRPFPCPLAPYGCKSTFGTKNEWKRHFSTQHMRLGFWRCDQCPATDGRTPNDFNRKDLFMQHVRRMHPSQHSMPSPRSRKKGKNAGGKRDAADQEVTDAALRCHKQLRQPPIQSMCVVCDETFQGMRSWEKRMEHLGKHLEDASDLRALKVDRWATDVLVERWMLDQGILRSTLGGEVVVADDNKSE